MRKVFSQEQNPVGQEHEEKKKTHTKRQVQQGCNRSIKKKKKKKKHFAAKDLCVKSSRVGKRHTDHQNSILEHYNLSFQGLPVLCLFF